MKTVDGERIASFLHALEPVHDSACEAQLRPQSSVCGVTNPRRSPATAAG